MSLLRAPIRRLLATTPTRATTTKHTVQVPVFARPFNLRSYSTTIPEPPTTINPPPIITPAVSSPVDDPSSSTSSSSSSSTSPPSSSTSPTPSSTSPPSATTPSIPQGYQGPDRKPTLISAPLPPYVRPPPNLPYYVQRSKTNHLPVYTLSKAHGTRKETRIRHVRGDAKVLAEALSSRFNLPLGRKEGVWVNYNVGQVMVKGHYADEISQYLDEAGF